MRGREASACSSIAIRTRGKNGEKSLHRSHNAKTAEPSVANDHGTGAGLKKSKFDVPQALFRKAASFSESPRRFDPPSSDPFWKDHRSNASPAGCSAFGQVAFRHVPI